jgi:hypothetical protein
VVDREEQLGCGNDFSDDDHFNEFGCAREDPSELRAG